MTQTAATYATAPRDPEALAKLGRFQLRTLAQEVPAWNNEDERQAFLKLGTPEQATAVHRAMLERDKKEKGGGGKAATTTAATTTTKTRTPSNKSSNASAEAPVESAPSGVANTTAGAVFALLSEIKNKQVTIEAKIDDLAASNESLRLQLAGNNKLGQVAVSLALQMSEQVLNASASEVLQGAIGQLDDIAGQLAEVVGDTGGDDDEGNDGNEGNE